MSGLQFLPFNSLYQLAVDQAEGVLDDATTMLLVPDLIAYRLTGAKRAGRTNASTTGLLDVAGGDWNTALIDRLGFPRGALPAARQPRRGHRAAHGRGRRRDRRRPAHRCGRGRFA